MKLHELKRSKWLKDKARQKGRWNASKGNTSGKGHKGQKARSGAAIKPFFEGWQTPLVMRMPKAKGFKRHYKLVTEYEVINLADLQADANIEKLVNKEVLQKAGYIKTLDTPVKILGNGEFSKKITFEEIEKYSTGAVTKITSAGGKVANQENTEEASS